MFARHKEIASSIEGLTDEERELLYSGMNIHGHLCGAMPIGFRAGLAALKALGSERERNMDKFAIIYAGNRHAAGCFSDGVQFATGCTFGKGIMKKEPKGKWSFMVVDKVKGKAVKVKIKAGFIKKVYEAPFISEYRIKGIKPTDVPKDAAEAAFKRPFGLKLEDFLEIEGPFDYKVEKAPASFNLEVCEKCGEAVAENYVRLEDGKKVCPDCFNYND